MAEIKICDFCESMIKPNDAYHVSIAYEGDKQFIETQEDYNAYCDYVSKNIKHICSSCNLLLAELFKIKKNNLSTINKELFAMWKQPQKEVKNGKTKSKRK